MCCVSAVCLKMHVYTDTQAPCPSHLGPQCNREINICALNIMEIFFLSGGGVVIVNMSVFYSQMHTKFIVCGIITFYRFGVPPSPTQHKLVNK